MRRPALCGPHALGARGNVPPRRVIAAIADTWRGPFGPLLLLQAHVAKKAAAVRGVPDHQPVWRRQIDINAGEAFVPTAGMQNGATSLRSRRQTVASPD